MFLATLAREVRLGLRSGADFMIPLIFFVMVVSLFPLGLAPTGEVLAPVAPGIIWTAALLACLLASDRIFRRDYEEGMLEQMLLSDYPLLLLLLAKVYGQWLLTGLPLTLLAPLLASLLFMPEAGLLPLLAGLFAGTQLLLLLGATGAALTVTLPKGSLLLAVIILPLYAPPLILGSLAVDAALGGQPWSGYLLWQGALLFACLPLAPAAAAAGLRATLE